MPCYSCSTEFGLLKKEIGCDECGFSFCPKCCKKQHVPGKGGESCKMCLCNQCYKQLTSGKSQMDSKGSPPLAHKRRMEALKKQSMSVDSSSHQWSNEVDKDLAERLQKLKRERIKADLPSEDEIGKRLAILKGMDPERYTAPPIQVFRPSEKLTSDEQAHNLMKQFTAEAVLDAKRVKPEDEIAARLAKLRDQEPPEKPLEFNIPPDLVNEPSQEMEIDEAYLALQKESTQAAQIALEETKKLNTDEEYKNALSSLKKQKEDDKNENEEGEDEEAERLVQKLLAADISDEVDELEFNDNSESSDTKQNDEEELPWCVICTEDAKIKCFGCEGDLYCNRCFKECHDSLDIKDHKNCPFLPPKMPVV